MFFVFLIFIKFKEISKLHQIALSSDPCVIQQRWMHLFLTATVHINFTSRAAVGTFFSICSLWIDVAASQ